MDEEPADFRAAAAAAAHVTRLALLVIVGTWGGSWLDARLDTGPFLLLTGLLVGALIGFVSFVRGMQEIAPPDEPPDADAS